MVDAQQIVNDHKRVLRIRNLRPDESARVGDTIYTVIQHQPSGTYVRRHGRKRRVIINKEGAAPKSFVAEASEDLIISSDTEVDEIVTNVESSPAEIQPPAPVQHNQTISEGDLPMTREKKAASSATPKSTILKALVYGLGITQFIHWMRDRKFTVDEARHVLRANGFTIAKKKAKDDNKTILDQTVRPHLHCFPKFCKKKAPKLTADQTAAIMKLKKETPADEEVPGAKPPKARKAAKRAAAKGKPAKKTAAKRPAAKKKAAAAAAAGQTA